VAVNGRWGLHRSRPSAQERTGDDGVLDRQQADAVVIDNE